MSDAVEGAEVILYGVSKRYKESANCRLEANYGHQQGWGGLCRAGAASLPCLWLCLRKRMMLACANAEYCVLVQR